MRRSLWSDCFVFFLFFCYAALAPVIDARQPATARSTPKTDARRCLRFTFSYQAFGPRTRPSTNSPPQSVTTDGLPHFPQVPPPLVALRSLMLRATKISPSRRPRIPAATVVWGRRGKVVLKVCHDPPPSSDRPPHPSFTPAGSPRSHTRKASHPGQTGPSRRSFSPLARLPLPLRAPRTSARAALSRMSAGRRNRSGPAATSVSPSPTPPPAPTRSSTPPSPKRRSWEGGREEEGRRDGTKGNVSTPEVRSALAGQSPVPTWCAAGGSRTAGPRGPPAAQRSAAALPPS